ncbi:hypothetical protein TUM12370_27950 [Salmonella enterica subsp. enterica serovar Choleraesuis]|nr:hypothetical protein TUM12370_27950 [Salmonella enterica subsp. enterica serovar Choleraesuis]
MPAPLPHISAPKKINPAIQSDELKRLRTIRRELEQAHRDDRLQIEQLQKRLKSESSAPSLAERSDTANQLLKQEIESLRTEASQARSRNETLQQQLASTQKQSRLLEQQVLLLNGIRQPEASSEQLAKLHQELKTSQQKEQALTSELKMQQAAAESGQDKLREELARAEKQLTEQQQQLSASGGDKALLAKVQQELKTSQQKEQALTSELKAQQAAAESGQDKLRQELARAEKQLTEQQKLLSDSGGEKALLAKVQQELKTSQQKEQVLTSELKAQQAAAESGQDKLREELARAQKQLTEQQQQLSASGGDKALLAKVQQELKSSQQKEQALTSELKAQRAASLEELKVARLLSVSQQSAETAQSLANEQLNADLKARDKSLAELKQQVITHQEQITQLTQKTEADKGTITTLKAQLQDEQDKNNKQQALSKTQSVAATQPVSLKTEDEIRDYAVGVLWGRDILTQLYRQHDNGINISQKQALYGVSDMVNNKLQLSQDKLVAALKKTENQVSQIEKNKKASAKEQLSEGKAYQAKFAKQKGVKHASLGYDYRIEKQGSGKIKSDEEVAIVVRESLTNGKVIKDMRKAGKVLALPFREYPPLMQSAIELTGRGGEITVVTPPELAYGERGAPPDIPANATMVYTIEVLPAGA